MEDATLNVILGRFDKLDEKFDKQATELSAMASRVTAVETKLEPIISDALFKNRLQLVTHAAASAVGAGIILAVRAIWPPHVAPPSILGK